MSAADPTGYAGQAGGEGFDAYETRCRRLLRAYPRSWRAHREEELLGVLLGLRDDETPEGVRPGSPRPSRSLQVDLLTGGLETRWDQFWSLLSSPVRDRIATMSAVLGAAVCLLLIVYGEVRWPGMARLSASDLVLYGYPPDYTFPVLQTAGVGVYGLWLLAFGVALAGRVRLARWLLAATAVVAVLLAAVRVVPHPPVYALGPLVLAALVGTCGRTPAGRRARGWMAVAFIAVTGALALTQVGDGGYPLHVWDPVDYFYRHGAGLDGMRSLSVGVTVLTAVAAVVAAIASARGRRWFLAVALTALPYLYLLVFSASGGLMVSQTLPNAAALTAVPLLLLAGAAWGRRVSRTAASASPQPSRTADGR